MSATILIPLGQALAQGLLLSPSEQVYYNNLKRWQWLQKCDRAGRPTRQLWVDLVGFKTWCWETGRQLGCARVARLDLMIAELSKEAAIA